MTSWAPAAAPAVRAPVQPGPARPGAPDPDLDAVLAAGALHSLYQPIVDLETGHHVAVEALARGPAGSPLERPDVLFARARAAGRLAELDAACRAAAFSGARAAGLAAPWTLFVNTEPEVAAVGGFGAPAGPAAPRVVVEFTERALTHDPAGLLRTVRHVRSLGHGVALDDVGADPASLALLPLLHPDVVKLDLGLVQRRPSAQIAAIVAAVNAQAERSGALVLAEGIETPAHLRTARALGATLGQGWLFGRPGRLWAPGRRPPSPALAPASRRPGADVASPFALAAVGGRVRQGDKDLLVEVSKHLERQAASVGESAVVVAAFQEARHFTPATRRRYAALAAGAAFVGVLGRGLGHSPLDGVRGGSLADGDPLLQEWDIAVVSPHFAATLIARDLGDTGPEAGRRFDFVLSYDRAVAVDVAVCLMARITPESTSEPRSGPPALSSPDRSGAGAPR